MECIHECTCVQVVIDNFFFFKQKTAYEMRISDWSSDVCSSDLNASIRPGSHEAYSRLFPEPRQARLDALATPETDIRAIEAPALIIHGDRKSTRLNSSH